MYQAQKQSAKQPVVFVVASGPGCSPVVSSFLENGPQNISIQNSGNMQLEANEYSWNYKANIVQVDHPVGKGFSYSDSAEDNLLLSEDESMLNLYEFINKWIDKFPDFKNNDIYIMGSHYESWIVPLVAHHIQTTNKLTDNKINLKGIGIGDGWINPEVQLSSLSKQSQKNKLNLASSQLFIFQQMVQQSKVSSCFRDCTNGNKRECLVLTLLVNTLSNQIIVKNNKNPYNVKENCQTIPQCYNFEYVEKFINDYRSILNVNKEIKYNSCLKKRQSDMLLSPSVGTWVNKVGLSLIALLENNVEVLMQYGENDFKFNQFGGLETISYLKYNNSKNFNKVKFENFQDKNNNLIGKVKKQRNLKFQVAKDSGAFIGLDNPKALQQIFSNFIDENSNKQIKYKDLIRKKI